MPSTLWTEAQDQFVAELRQRGYDERQISSFLSQQSSPEDAKKVASAIAADARTKWTSEKLSSKWVGRIMANIDRFIAIGDYAMKGAPEPVGLAWFAVKQVLDATQNNQKLYGFFGDALNSITEMLILVRTYDELYDQDRTTASDVVLQLFQHIREVYAATLDFGISVRRHITGGKRSKLAHTVKDAFNTNLSEFEDKKGRIDGLRSAILEASQAAYQERSLGSFDRIGDCISSILSDIENGRLEMKEMFDELKQMAKHKPTIEELVRQEVEKIQASLNALPPSNRALKDVRHPGTCEWIFENQTYKEWTQNPGLLVLRGDSGSGKSVLLSFIAHTLDAIHISGEATVNQIENTILARVYDLIPDDPLLLQRASMAFKRKERTGNKADMSRDKRSEVYDFANVLGALKSILCRDLYVVIDATVSSQAELISSLEDANGLAHFLFASRDVPGLRVENHDDIHSVVRDELAKLPGWSDEERQHATAAVLEKTGTNFKFLVEVALPYLRQPFPRPLTRYLDQLPDGFREDYSRFVNRLSGNYRKLLEIALTWTLFADPPVTVNEIMDSYIGTYDTGQFDDKDTGDPYVTPPLFIQQLSEAGGPFLDIENGVVTVKDIKSTREFCTGKDEEPDSICPACHHDHGGTSIRLTDKKAHMDLASIMFRHIGSERFKRRFFGDVPVVSDIHSGDILELQARSESDTVPEADEGSAPRTEQPSGEASDIAVGRSGKTVVTSDDEASSQARILQSRAEDSLVSDTEAEVNQVCDTDTDASMDSEDRSQPDLGDYSEDRNGFRKRNLRNEIQNLFFHARKLETLLSAEEKLGSDWQSLQDQIYDFIMRGGYLPWRLVVAPDISEVWTPAVVGAFYGLTTFLGRYLSEVDAKEVLHQAIDGKYVALDYALERPHRQDVLQLLLDRGADPNHIPSASTWSTFQYGLVSYYCSYDYVDLLLKYGASCTQRNATYDSAPLHRFAIAGTDPSILTLLLNNPYGESSDINAKDRDDETPLHYLMSRSNVPIELLKAFLRAGALVDAETKNSTRPLGVAALYGETTVLRLLIERTDDVDDDNSWGRTALHGAAWGNQTETVSELLKAGADISRKDKHGRNALFFACLGAFNSHDAARLIFKSMIDKGIPIHEINSPTSTSRTPLREAAAHGLDDLVKAIGSDKVNLHDSRKHRTALHCAAMHGQAQCAQLLITAGADLSLKDHGGNTPLDLCRDKWAAEGHSIYEQTASVLIDGDAASAAKDKHLRSIAATHGAVAILKKLSDAGAPLNDPDEYGWTPLAIAKQYRHPEAVEFLSRSLARSPKSPNRWLGNSQVAIDDGGSRISFFGSGPICLTANHPVPTELSDYYFEVTIPLVQQEDSRTLYVRLGFSTTEGRFQQFPGWKSKLAPMARSWAYHADDGGLFHQQKSKVYGDGYGLGDTVGAGVNFGTRTIFFTKNGQLLGKQRQYRSKYHSLIVAEKHEFTEVSGRLFPAIGFMWRNVVVETNFGGKPFGWQHREQVYHD